MILEFVLALLPIIWLIVALTALKIPGFKACTIALAIAYALAVFVWKMPFADSMRAVAEGAALASGRSSLSLLPRSLLITSALQLARWK